MREAFWPLGLAAEYDPGLAAAAQTILAGDLDTADFEATRRPIGVELSVDSGHGWHAGQRRPLRINRNGLSYVSFDLRAEHIRALRFDPCDRPAMFRIDWIDLALRVRGNSELQRLRIEGSEQLSGLIYLGCRWLYDGVAIGFGNEAEIQIPLATRAAGEVYGVEFTAAMAVMPLPATDRPVDLHRTDFGTSLTWALGKMRAEADNGGAVAVGRGALRLAKRRLR
jgi:hypothetical protein